MLRLQYVQADFSSVEVNIRMKDLRDELDLRRRYRVILLDLEIEFEPPPFIGCVRRPLDVAQPVKEVVLNWLENEVLVPRARELEQLLVQSITCDHRCFNLYYNF